MPDENSPNNAYNEFLRIFLGLYNEAFPKQKIKIKRKSFNSPWMTKGLVKSSKKKQRLYEKYLKNRNPVNELNYKQYKTFFKSLKNKSKKNYYSGLIDSYKYNIKKNVGCYEINYWKQKSHQCPFSQFYHVEKQINIPQKGNCGNV